MGNSSIGIKYLHIATPPSALCCSTKGVIIIVYLISTVYVYSKQEFVLNKSDFYQNLLKWFFNLQMTLHCSQVHGCCPNHWLKYVLNSSPLNLINSIPINSQFNAHSLKIDFTVNAQSMNELLKLWEPIRSLWSSKPVTQCVTVGCKIWKEYPIYSIYKLALCMTVVTPLLKHWGYHSLAPSHLYIYGITKNIWIIWYILSRICSEMEPYHTNNDALFNSLLPGIKWGSSEKRNFKWIFMIDIKSFTTEN